MTGRGRPPGTGWLQEALAGFRSPFTISEAANELGTSYMSVAHTARNIVNEGLMVRVRRGVYRHLTAEEWEALWERLDRDAKRG